MKIMIGQRFGKLTVVRTAGMRYSSRVYLCACDCGKVAPRVSEEKLLHGQTACRSCAHNPNPEGAFRQAFKSYKDGAARRGFAFELTLIQFISLVKQSCYYCGAAPRVTCWSKSVAIQAPMNGVDRKYPQIGYLLTNCVPCCGQCNRAKSLMPPEDFVAWARAICSVWKET